MQWCWSERGEEIRAFLLVSQDSSSLWTILISIDKEKRVAAIAAAIAAAMATAKKRLDLFFLKYLKAILITLTVSLILFFFGRSEMRSQELLPGVTEFNSRLLSEFEKIRKERGLSYRARTRHLDQEGKALFTNRLFLEKSPYLLQHAHNPVNWYPWGEEAFQQAQKTNRPILLSVGYSTCHWCHVMEEESFEDLEIAEYLNKNYVAIKVDREERPDIDAVYMQAVQMMTGRGGWPMTVWLRPNKEVYYGGTYYPARTGDRGSSTGFLNLLKELKKIYEEKQEAVKQTGKEITALLQKNLTTAKQSLLIPGGEVFKTLYAQLKKRADLEYGGIKGAPKFPSSVPIRFLLRSYAKTSYAKTLHAKTLHAETSHAETLHAKTLHAETKKDPEMILQIVKSSLEGMLKGGLKDHVGGGFHRYSTDSYWLVPHFEKMLYDQALLASTYLEAYHLLKISEYKETAVGILNYIARDMQSKEGGFYSATDADSYGLESGVRTEKKEGFYFTWTLEELTKILTDKKQLQLVINYYNVTSAGNFEGRNILYISKNLETVAKALGLELLEAKALLTSAHKELYEIREKRPLPLRDEKILSGWNGLMISAFVEAYNILGDKKYLAQAEKSSEFIWKNMYKEGRLHRSWREGEAYIGAYLEDYAFYMSALLSLFEATGDMKWFERTLKLDQILEKHFEDKPGGGFFRVSKKEDLLLVREKPLYDGAEPSGNSLAAMNLLRLSELTGDKSYKERAGKTLRALAATLVKSPISFSEALLALDFYHNTVYEMVLVLPGGDGALSQESKAFLKEIQQVYLPYKVLVTVPSSEVEERAKFLKTIAQKKSLKGRPTLYICEQGACQFPVSDLEELKKQLSKLALR